eukprot:361794-Chlamydomonas_euryale.AAC.8
MPVSCSACSSRARPFPLPRSNCRKAYRFRAKNVQSVHGHGHTDAHCRGSLPKYESIGTRTEAQVSAQKRLLVPKVADGEVQPSSKVYAAPAAMTDVPALQGCTSVSDMQRDAVQASSGPHLNGHVILRWRAGSF